MFSRYIISQSSGGPQLCQLINQRSKTNIYILAWTARTGYDRRKKHELRPHTHPRWQVINRVYD
jgi:hemolysin-activating ACP:hemolysin acyltransferase